MDVNDCVRLRVDLPEHGLRAGEVGTIVMVFDEPRRAYEVEFVNDAGETTAQLTLEPDQVEPA